MGTGGLMLPNPLLTKCVLMFRTFRFRYLRPAGAALPTPGVKESNPAPPVRNFRDRQDDIGVLPDKPLDLVLCGARPDLVGVRAADV